MIKDIIESVAILDKKHEEAKDAYLQILSDEIGATVIGINGIVIHVYEAEWVANHTGVTWKEIGGNLYPWQVEWKDDGLIYIALCEQEDKDRLTEVQT